ncbi:MAG: hypothetical protein HY711_02580 [Candidatus Melainabacteria bacterium]|nr:hypothetical protein [Candidatus Melainabacteria bacterium]
MALEENGHRLIDEAARVISELSSGVRGKSQPLELDASMRTLHVRYIVAGNPNTPKEVLARLANDTLENIRRRVAENPRTPVSVLLQMASDPNIDVRLSVAENPNTPPEVLEQLAADDNVDVRYGVAENPHIPAEILVRLADDDNPYVACRAQKTLLLVCPVMG